MRAAEATSRLRPFACLASVPAVSGGAPQADSRGERRDDSGGAPPADSGRAADAASAGGAAVLVTVVGPTSRRVVQVPAEVPVARLAPRLGELGGAGPSATVSLRGSRLHPEQTLAGLGVGNGAVLFVATPEPVAAAGADAGAHPTARSDPAGTAPEAMGGSAPAEDRAAAGAADPPAPTPWATARDRTRPASDFVLPPAGWAQRRPWRVAGGAAALLAAALVGLGIGVVSAGSPVAPRAGARALAVAVAWVDGGRYDGRVATGLPAGVGRVGPPPGGVVEAVGTASGSGVDNSLFVVVPRDGPAYGLSVTLRGTTLLYPPTPCPIPFLTSEVRGAVPVVSEHGPPRALRDATTLAMRWAAEVTVPGGPLGRLGYSLDGAAAVIGSWRARGGSGTVLRVALTLGLTPPGSTAGRDEDAARGALAAAAARLADAERRVAALRRSATRARAVAARDSRLVVAARAALAVAPPPDRPARVAALAGAAREQAGAQATAASAALALEHAVAAVVSARRAERAASGRVAAAVGSAPDRVGAVYDVLVGPTGVLLAWVPAGYQGGTRR